MRITAWIGAVLMMMGILLLVAANCTGKQAGASSAAAMQPRPVPVNPSIPPPAIPVAPQPATAGPPTIFEALLGVIDSTDEGRALDKDQRDQLRRDLTETNQVWRGMKEDMKESIRRANRRYAVQPSRNVPEMPAP